MDKLKKVDLLSAEKSLLKSGLLGYINHEILGPFGLALAFEYDDPDDGPPTRFDLYATDSFENNVLSPELLRVTKEKLRDTIWQLDEAGEGPPHDSPLRAFIKEVT